MDSFVRRFGVLTVAAVLSAATSGCGDSHRSGAGDGLPDAPVSRPYLSALQAALSFSSWFAHDSDEYCNQPHWTLNGHLPKRIVDSYSCHDMISPRQLRDDCDDAGGGATEIRHVRIGPGRYRYTAKWNGAVNCLRGHVPARRGTYEVVVQKYADGWAPTSYKILTGPGAGTSG